MKRMIREVCLTVIAGCILGQTQGQGLVEIRNEDGELVNGTTVFHATVDLNATDTVSFATSITGSEAKDIKVRRYEVWPVAGTDNFYCWGTCFNAAPTGTYPVWETPFWENLEPGESYRGFHAYHEAEGNAGTARYRFVFFDLADPFGPDSSWVDIDFGGTVGIQEGAERKASLEVWPNPSAGNDLQVNFSLGSGVNAQLVLYNVLGEQVVSKSLGATQGRVNIPTSSLAGGVYFASIETQGRAVATKRVVINP